MTPVTLNTPLLPPVSKSASRDLTWVNPTFNFAATVPEIRFAFSF
jgi:hypothetical protein